MTENLEERIRERARLRGLSQRDLAKAIGLDDAKMSKSLNHQRRFSSLELALIADELGTTVDHLLSGAAPREWRFAARVADPTADPSSTARPLVEDLSDAHDALGALGAPWSPPELERISTGGMYVEQAKKGAARAVARIGRPLRDLDTPTLISSVEKVFGINVVVTELPRACDGIAFEDGDFRVIVLAQSDRAERQRYTLAHEVGHILAGDARDAIVEEKMKSANGMDKKAEGRANSFAASLLMPPAELRHVLDGRPVLDVFDELVCTFCVSPSAMAWRLFNEDLLSENERETLQKRTSRESASRVGAMAEFAVRTQMASQPRAPWALVDRYLDLYAQGLTTLRPVANLLGWDIEGTIAFFSRDDAHEVPGNPEEQI